MQTTYRLQVGRSTKANVLSLAEVEYRKDRTHLM